MGLVAERLEHVPFSDPPRGRTIGDNGRLDEVDVGDADLTVSLHAGPETVEIAIEADDPDRPPRQRRFALMNIPRHLSRKAMADLARQEGERATAGRR